MTLSHLLVIILNKSFKREFGYAILHQISLIQTSASIKGMIKFMEKFNFMEYIIKETEHVRKAYDDRIDQTRMLERYSLIATGGIWSWCATNAQSPEVALLKWMPAIITFLFGIRAWGNAKAIDATRDYLYKIENYISLPEEIGWGKYLKNNQEPRLAMTAYLFWGILQLLTILIPIFYG